VSQPASCTSSAPSLAHAPAPPLCISAFLCGDLDPRRARRCCLRFRCSRASNA
jgi:hypothetical protein